MILLWLLGADCDAARWWLVGGKNDDMEVICGDASDEITKRCQKITTFNLHLRKIPF